MTTTTAANAPVSSASTNSTSSGTNRSNSRGNNNDNNNDDNINIAENNANNNSNSSSSSSSSTSNNNIDSETFAADKTTANNKSSIGDIGASEKSHRINDDSMQQQASPKHQQTLLRQGASDTPDRIAVSLESPPSRPENHTSSTPSPEPTAQTNSPILSSPTQAHSPPPQQPSTSSASSIPPEQANNAVSAAAAVLALNHDLPDLESPPQQSSKNQSNNNEQKRPMNAFLLFCKRQRSSVREKYPNLENRGITKILGDWWTKLDKDQKSKYTDLARQHKEAFMKANPDFKWCKTPVANNNIAPINNNVTNHNSSNHDINNSNRNDCSSRHQHQHQNHQQHHQQQQQNHVNQNYFNHLSHAPNHITPEALMHQHIVHMEVDRSINNSASMMDTFATGRQPEAPKPPKKRFLERNDPTYTAAAQPAPPKSINLTYNDANSLHNKESVVPYPLDQETVDRVIDEAFKEQSNNGNNTGTATCKYPRAITTTSYSTTSSLGTQPTSYSSSSTSTTSTYSTSADEPVDFSMNRTINATRQQIINNLVEKMLSEPADSLGATSKMNGIDGVHVGPPKRKENSDD